MTSALRFVTRFLAHGHSGIVSPIRPTNVTQVETDRRLAGLKPSNVARPQQPPNNALKQPGGVVTVLARN